MLETIDEPDYDDKNHPEDFQTQLNYLRDDINAIYELVYNGNHELMESIMDELSAIKQMIHMSSNQLNSKYDNQNYLDVPLENNKIYSKRLQSLECQPTTVTTQTNKIFSRSLSYRNLNMYNPS